MGKITKPLVFAFLLSSSVVFNACQKSLEFPGDGREAEEITIISPDIKPYKFERVNEQNFSSQGWREQQVNNTATNQVFSDESDYVEIVCGPLNNSDHRLIRGSITMNLPTSADPTLRRIRLRRKGYSGTLLSDLTELKYSTYVVQNCPTILVLQVDVDGDADNEFNIFYEPRTYIQPAGFPPLVLNAWQQWDALNEGVWHIEASQVSLPGDLADQECTIAELTTVFPNARIIDTPPVRHSGEGIRFTIGGSPANLFNNTIGYMDALIIGTKNEQVSTLYDFTCNQGNN